MPPIPDLMKNLTAPSPMITTSLLCDLMCSPIAMRADRLSAFVLPLVQQLSPRGHESHLRASGASAHPKLAAAGTDSEDDPEILPWDEPIYAVESGVAVLRIEGPIVKGYSNFVAWYYDCASSDRIEQALDEIRLRGDVSACVLLIRSPGGMATGTPEVAARIAALAQQKFVFAVTDTMACSAAYWMGCAATQFFTTLSADVGCIGTYIALYDYTEMLKEWGIKLELFKRGKFKAIGVLGNPLDKDARAFLDRDCGRTNDRFLAAVTAARPGVAKSTMEGQWFDGEEAVQLHLADRVVSGVGEVLAFARGVAGTPAADFSGVLTRPETHKSPVA